MVANRAVQTVDYAEELADRMFASSLWDFRGAAANVAADIIRTPLLPYGDHGKRTIRLKAENLQTLRSFKIRPAANVLEALSARTLAQGAATASAGNFGQGLAMAARRRAVRLSVHVPNTAAKVKIEMMRSLGAEVVEHTFADWWEIMSTRNTGRKDGVFIHPVTEVAGMHGDGTIGLELAEQWPEVDTVLLPIGGGGLAAGIALAFRALGKKARIIGCEIETSAPLAAALKAGRPVDVSWQRSFIDGIGSTRVLDEMWPLLHELVDDVIVVSEAEVRTAIKEMVLNNHIVAEGAGAVAAAAAMSSTCEGHNIAAIVTGGNIDPEVLNGILAGTP